MGGFNSKHSSNFSHLWSQSFNIPPAPLTEKNLPDQSGKVFLITGGYAGVGLALCTILYQHNATVYIAGRSETKANTAITNITSLHPNSKGQLHFLLVDLSDLTTIKPAVTKFLSLETKLHWLNQNAGVMIPPSGSTGAQGMDLTYQTNILGPFLLTKLLLPILKSTAATSPKSTVRVSWAGSLAVIVYAPPGGIQFTPDGRDLKYALTSPHDTYGVSKAANYYLSHAFGKLSGDKDGVLHTSYNPGNLLTELQRHTPAFITWILKKTMLFPSIFGAYTELYSGLSPDLNIEKNQGAYIVPWGRQWHVRADEEAEVKKEHGNDLRLYEWCDMVTKEFQ